MEVVDNGMDIHFFKSAARLEIFKTKDQEQHST
jgi:hypothetical protein